MSDKESSCFQRGVTGPKEHRGGGVIGADQSYNRMIAPNTDTKQTAIEPKTPESPKLTPLPAAPDEVDGFVDVGEVVVHINTF